MEWLILLAIVVLLVLAAVSKAGGSKDEFSYEKTIRCFRLPKGLFSGVPGTVYLINGLILRFALY